MAVNRKPQQLLGALQRSGAIAPRASVTWCSPLEKEDFQEYRDGKALEKAGIAKSNLKKALEEFWPARGPVWDALGITPEGHPLFVEAKAHIPEAVTPATRASPTSLKLIERSLGKQGSSTPREQRRSGAISSINTQIGLPTDTS